MLPLNLGADDERLTMPLNTGRYSGCAGDLVDADLMGLAVQVLKVACRLGWLLVVDAGRSERQPPDHILRTGDGLSCTWPLKAPHTTLRIDFARSRHHTNPARIC